ncbi:glycosyltransferase family 4 protein [Arcicella sp. LKC2W]|uniref:glycosyltransferase family 4 protein n=1 Tax=Arcicella sp. LKC2W TaxID=2984198 RepID=UPI002B1F8041|nr:glycosyltransferase family 4 protein [Arcicella sp. LKC2W]MEA5461297.1 glycosyltransferase family 4 protein [Arcicella sp. LKC2W]
MKILILTFYFPPDFCAGSFRSSALVESLQQKIANDDSIEVIAAMPNRYQSKRDDALTYEQSPNLTIHRIPMPDHKSGIVDQILAFWEYWKGVNRLTKNQHYDLIYATSSRLFTGFLGAKIAKNRQISLYLDIRDILSDTIRDVFKNKLIRFFLLPIIKQIEKYTIRSATHLNLVSEGFSDTFAYFKGKTTFFTNGIDDTFLENDFTEKPENSIPIITYAGNIGEGQGLEKIIPEVAKRLEDKYIFNVIGDGGTKQRLVDKLTDLKVNNVKLISTVSRSELIQYYYQSDFLFLHLNDYQAFEKVLPSKIFEYGATYKPIIAGVNGYAREFLQTYLSDSLIFQPCNIDEFIHVLENFESQNICREQFTRRFNRKNIMDKMAESILELSTLEQKHH